MGHESDRPKGKVTPEQVAARTADIDRRLYGEQEAVKAVQTVAGAAGLLEEVTPEQEAARVAARDAAGVTAEEEARLVYGEPDEDDGHPVAPEPGEDPATPSDEHPLADAGRERDFSDDGLTPEQLKMLRDNAGLIWSEAEAPPTTLTPAQARYVLAAQQAAQILRGQGGVFTTRPPLVASEVTFLADQIIEAEAEAHLTERELYPRRTVTMAPLGFGLTAPDAPIVAWESRVERMREDWGAIFDGIKEKMLQEARAQPLRVADRSAIIPALFLKPGDVFTDAQGLQIAAEVTNVYLTKAGSLEIALVFEGSDAHDAIVYDDPREKVRVTNWLSEA